ncbi:XdhC family protein [Candidatus Bathyarchaeota archaeon]|nr:XdhC family protein [Candidatus Bathyarchaeota archaeon]
MSDPVLITKLKESLLKGERAVLCTVIEKKGHGPRDVGSKMLVTEEGDPFGSIGGGGMERLLIKQALDVLKTGKCRTLHFAMGIPPREGMIAIDSQCGGEVKIFMDIIKPEPRLFIMGSGLIAKLTAKFAKNCGFEIFIVDDAPTSTHNNFPNMIIINDRFPESLKQVNIKNSDYVVILHGDTFFELAALRHALDANPSFIGLLGSKNKMIRHKETLKSEGYSETQLELLHGPIGIDINAETPEEISISIVAELINKKRS